MLPSKARWNLQQINRELASKLAEELRIPLFAAMLLAGRGIVDKQQAEQFLAGDQDQSHDPFLLGGMLDAVNRIRAALERGEKIRIYGDYDADGVSGTAFMIQLMKRLHASFDHYIPNRVSEGYGINRQALEHAKKSGISLIVTVDTGISAVQEIAYANELGLDVIVTDHHEPPSELPSAYALINPKKPGDAYPFKSLAGVGVALKLAQALLDEVPDCWFELAAIGTIADLMPLTDENRHIVRKGLEVMRSSAFPGIRALFGVAGIEIRQANAIHIGYAIAPRINASGRLEHADASVRLLLADNEQEAEQLAFNLDALNKERQRIVEEIALEAFRQIEQAHKPNQKVLVVAGENWNVGVVGIVASRILERYFRPVIVLGIDPDNGWAKGSARSIPGFDMHRALSEADELLEHYGGHQAAAGMTLRRENIAPLRDRLQQLAERWLQDDDLTPVIEADLECEPHEVTLEAIEHIERLGPFGMGNPLPRFILRGARIQELKIMGRDKQHMKLTLSSGQQGAGNMKEALGFGWGEFRDLISTTSTVDILGEMSLNEWNGVRKPQIVIQDLGVPHVQVFDWRSKSEASDSRILGLLEKLKRLNGTSGAHALIVFDRRHLHRLSEELGHSDYALYWVDPSGRPMPANEASRSSAGPAGVESLLLHTLPGTKGQIESALLSFPHVARYYALFAEDGKPFHSPSRESLKKVYVSLLQREGWRLDQSGALADLSRRTGLSAAMVETAIEIFEELAFVERRDGYMRCVKNPGKKDLQESSRFRSGLERGEVERLFVYSSAAELAEWFWHRQGTERIYHNKTEEVI